MTTQSGSADTTALRDERECVHEDAARFRFLCQRPDWRFIEEICLSITFDSSDEFLLKLRAAIDERMAKPQHPFGDLAGSLETPTFQPGDDE